MSKMTIDMDSLKEGLREIRLCDGVFDLLEETCESIAERAGDDFCGDVQHGKNRCQGRVTTTTEKGFFRAMHNHTLTKVLKG